MILWKPGEYGKIYFSQLYPHFKECHVHDWSTIVYSTETTGAIRRRVEEPPVTGGQIPPHAHVEVDGHDPIHPDDHGLPEHEDINLPDEDANDSGEQDDDDDDGDDDDDDADDDDGIMILQRLSGGQPPARPPYPSPSIPQVVSVPNQRQPQVDNSDETID